VGFFLENLFFAIVFLSWILRQLFSQLCKELRMHISKKQKHNKQMEFFYKNKALVNNNKSLPPPMLVPHLHQDRKKGAETASIFYGLCVKVSHHRYLLLVSTFSLGMYLAHKFYRLIANAKYHSQMTSSACCN